MRGHHDRSLAEHEQDVLDAWRVAAPGCFLQCRRRVIASFGDANGSASVVLPAFRSRFEESEDAQL